MNLTSKQLEQYLDALDVEPPREPYDIERRDKLREAIRKDIERLRIIELDEVDRNKGRF